MKYKVGDSVVHFTRIKGMITKIHKDNKNYTFVYLDHNADPDSRYVEECEIIENTKTNSMGFGKSKRKG